MGDTRAETLPELERVYWRPRVSERSLIQRGRLWTFTTVVHAVPYLFIAALLIALQPLTAPVALIALVIAWAVPELYAARGAKVLSARASAASGADQLALGLLGDLLDHAARELHASTGLVLERGGLGAWVVGEAGTVLVRPGGHRVYCYCVRATDSGLPAADRIAHLLLALRADEAGFATVANLAFCGAAWRLRRHLGKPAVEALRAARAAAGIT